MQTTMWCTASVFSTATTTGDGPRVEIELERRGARVGEQALLELRVDPGARDQPRAVGGRARNEPVDPLAHVLAADHALLDQQLLERPDARCGGGLVAVRDRRMRGRGRGRSFGFLQPVLEDVDVDPVAGLGRDSRARPRAARSRQGTAAAPAARPCRRRASPGFVNDAWTRSTGRSCPSHSRACGDGPRATGPRPSPAGPRDTQRPSLASSSPAASTPFSVRIVSIEYSQRS